MTNETSESKTEPETPTAAPATPATDAPAGTVPASSQIASGTGFGGHAGDPNDPEDRRDPNDPTSNFAPPTFMISAPATTKPAGMTDETWARVQAAREAARKDPEGNRVTDMPNEADLAAAGVVPPVEMTPPTALERNFGRSETFSMRYNVDGFSSAVVSVETDSRTGAAKVSAYANVTADGMDGTGERLPLPRSGGEAARMLVDRLRAMADLVERDIAG